MNRRYRKKNHLFEYVQYCIVWAAPDEEYIKWRNRYYTEYSEEGLDAEFQAVDPFFDFLDSCDMGLGGWIGKAGIQKNHPYTGRLVSCTQRDLDLVLGWLYSHEGWEGLAQGLTLLNDWWPEDDDKPWSRMRTNGTVDRYGWYRGIFRKKKERRFREQHRLAISDFQKSYNSKID